MNCEEARRHLSLYLDSEGDPEVHLQLGDHLAMCPACAEYFAREEHFERVLVAKLRDVPPTEQLWEGIERRILEGARETKPGAAVRSGMPWFGWLAAGLAAAAALALVIVGLMVGGDEGRGHLSAEVAQWHRRIIERDVDPELWSNSLAEVEAYLRERSGFPVRCPPAGQGGFELRACGLVEIEHERAAYIAGEIGRTPVSIFLMPDESVSAFPDALAHLPRENSTHECREGRYEMIAARLHGNLVVIVGETGRQTLREVLAGYGQHHGTLPTPTFPGRAWEREIAGR